MSETTSSEITRRELLKTVGGTVVAGAAGLGISSAVAQQPPPRTETIELIIAKTKPVGDPSCRAVEFQPGATRVEDGMRIEQDVAVKMRDGKTMYVDIYRPDGANNVPAIIAYGGGKAPRTNQFRRGVPLPHPGSEGTLPGTEWGLVEISKYAKFEGPDPAYWCKHGYAVVNTDYRGSNRSEGIGQLYGRQGGRDCYDLTEFLAAQPWSNGKVGMSGNSQVATWQWMAAAERPPHMAAIAPWEGWSDLYRQIVMPGGIPEVGIRSGAVRNWCGGEGVEDVIAMMRKYPLMNEYWEGKIARLENINIPIYVTANFKHWHCLGSLDGFRKVPVRDKWLRVIENFEWPDYYALPQMEDLRRFFDRYLKGIQNDWEMTPRVRLSVLDPGGLDQLNRPEKEWPLARTQYEKLYLDASAGALSSQPVQRESQTQYASGTGQANFIVRFDRETELTGYLKLRLWMEAEGADDLDLFVYVQKLDRKGEWLPSKVLNHPHPGAQGWLRVSHRELDPARSTPSEPYVAHRRQQMLRPKEVVPVEIGIVPTSMLWHPGQQLRVVVAGHFMNTRGPDWWERWRYESLTGGAAIIHTGGKYDSHLLVPRIPI